jgi:hypothetical protein
LGPSPSKRARKEGRGHGWGQLVAETTLREKLPLVTGVDPSSSWPGTTLTDPCQPSLGWLDVRPHASNRVLVTIVTQGAVGLEKSRAAAGRERRRRAGQLAAAVGRMRALWICL